RSQLIDLGIPFLDLRFHHRKVLIFLAHGETPIVRPTRNRSPVRKEWSAVRHRRKPGRKFAEHAISANKRRQIAARGCRKGPVRRQLSHNSLRRPDRRGTVFGLQPGDLKSPGKTRKKSPLINAIRAARAFATARANTAARNTTSRRLCRSSPIPSSRR